MKLSHRGKCILFKYDPNPNRVFGFFDETDGQIYISSQLTLLARECVFFHETSHRDCFKRGCKCWKKGTDYLCEYHAMRGELDKVLADGRKSIRAAYIKQVKAARRKYTSQPKVYNAHLAALKQLKKTNKYKRAIRLEN